MLPNSTTTAANPSAHDSNLVDILLTSALDGEYVRDQISGTYTGYMPQQEGQAAASNSSKNDD
ncbi:hypothetical protein GGF44_003420, partial [Coemansia sp. RSA 1694]